MRFEWPLTGRSKETRLIGAALAAQDVAGIVICGAAGVGKSRVAREALEAAASKGSETRWAVASYTARALPLGALAYWAGAEVTDHLELVGSVIESLTSSVTGAQVVVGIDDAHLLDDLSAFVLHQIVQRGAAKVVATIRDGERITAPIQEIWKAGQFEWLDLQPLSPDETATLLSATLGGPLDPDAAQRLWKLTQGNVLYLRNILEQEVGHGRLASRHGYWRWTGDPVIAPDLVDMIESRIGALPTEVSDVIDVLAVGEPLELESLLRITDRAAVEDADLRGLIGLDEVDDAMEVRVAHPLYGEVRRRRAPSTRLRRLRGLVAAELATRDDRDDARTVVRRAALMMDSDREPDSALLVRAAQGATGLADHALADQLADAAIRAGAGHEANVIRGRALTWLGRSREAEAVLADIDATNLTETDRARLLFQRASNMMWTMSDPVGAKKLAEDASRTASSLSRNWFDAIMTAYWAPMANPAAAWKSSENVVLDELPDIIGSAAAWALTIAYGDAGRTDDAAGAAEAGYAIVSRSFDSPHMRFQIGDNHVTALLLAGRIAEAVSSAERLCAEAPDLPGAAQLLSAAVAGRAALGAGRLDAACTVLDTACELLLDDVNGLGYRYQIARTIALAMLGSTGAATAGLAVLERQRHPSWRFVDHEASVAHAWVAACRGALSEAVATLSEAAETARHNGQFAAEVMCLQTAAQFGDRTSGTRLHELSTMVEGPRAGIAARFAVALHADAGAELNAASEEFEHMGDLVAAADAAAHAAIAYRHHDLRGSGLGCLARAEMLAQRCGGAITPALRQAAEPLPLSDREREIVMLIGEGLSNRAVAQQLTLSVRTVEGHIYRAMARTGVTSREELAALLPRR